MTGNPYMNKYQQTQVHTASPEQIMLMLYDGAVRFLNQAKQGMDERNFGKKGTGISRAMAIIEELNTTLDFNQGGEIAENLDALYHYMLQRLTHANVKNDPAALEEVRDMLADLRQTWADAIEQLKKQQAAAEAETHPGQHGSIAATG